MSTTDTTEQDPSGEGSLVADAMTGGRGGAKDASSGDICLVLPSPKYRSYKLRGDGGAVETISEVEVSPHFTNIIEEAVCYSDDECELQLSSSEKDVRWRSIHHQFVNDPFSNLDNGTDLGYIVREWWSADPNVDRFNRWVLPNSRPRGRGSEEAGVMDTPILRRVVSRWTTPELARKYIRYNLDTSADGQDVELVAPDEESTDDGGHEEESAFLVAP